MLIRLLDFNDLAQQETNEKATDKMSRKQTDTFQSIDLASFHKLSLSINQWANVNEHLNWIAGDNFDGGSRNKFTVFLDSR